MKKDKLTNYRKAWIEYRKSDEWKRLTDTMKKSGIKQRYASNILQAAFGSGWSATETEIKFID